MVRPVFTWITPIRDEDERQAALDRLLERIGAEAREPDPPRPLIPFRRLPMLHFASVTIFEPPGEPRLLVFEHDIDERQRGVDEYVTLLVRHARPALEAIYQCCVGGDEAIAAGNLRGYLDRHTHYPQLYHLGHPGRSLASIGGDQTLRKAITHVLDRQPRPRERVRELLAAVWQRVNVPPSASKRWEPVPLAGGGTGAPRAVRWAPAPPGSRARALAALALFGALAGAAVFVVFDWLLNEGHTAWAWLMAGLVVLVVALHKSSGRPWKAVLKGAAAAAAAMASAWLAGRFDPPAAVAAIAALPAAVILWQAAVYLYVIVRMRLGDEHVEPAPEARVRELEKVEGLRTQNHIAGLTIVRGPFKRLRILRLRLSLRVLSLWYRAMFVHGRLDRVPSIHYGHWTAFDDKLLFLVNYDGGWDTYLDDFFRTLAGGVAFVWYDTLWGRARNFPRTLDPARLKRWVRQTQAAERAWYVAPAYDGQTVAAINTNTDVRRILLGPRWWQRRLRRKMGTWPRQLAMTGD